MRLFDTIFVDYVVGSEGVGFCIETFSECYFVSAAAQQCGYVRRLFAAEKCLPPCVQNRSLQLPTIKITFIFFVCGGHLKGSRLCFRVFLQCSYRCSW